MIPTTNPGWVLRMKQKFSVRHFPCTLPSDHIGGAGTAPAFDPTPSSKKPLRCDRRDRGSLNSSPESSKRAHARSVPPRELISKLKILKRKLKKDLTIFHPQSLNFTIGAGLAATSGHFGCHSMFKICPHIFQNFKP